MINEDIIKQIELMTVTELNALVKAIEEKFGVSAAMMASPAVVGTAEEGAVVEEKDAFDVVLKEAGGQKIQVIKVIREATGKGLKEAKDIADKAGALVKEGVKKAEAEELKKKLEEVGATVELK